MKQFSFFSLLIITLFACGLDKNSPEYVTEQYLIAIKAKNWVVAKSYSEQSNIDAIDCLIRIGEERSDILEIKDIECEINDNTASCSFCCTTYGKNGEGQENLIKIKDEWKIVGVKEQCPDQDPDYKKKSTRE